MPRPSHHAVRRGRRSSRRSRRPESGFAGGLRIAALGGLFLIVAAHQWRPLSRPVDAGSLWPSSTRAADPFSARFGLCHSGGGRDCVVDGDTFWLAGEKYRIADIDTPETHPARCAREAALGAAATERLRQWLNDGGFDLEPIGRDTDIHGRKLRIVTRGGDSVGDLLVAEGLARPWEGRRRPWC